MNLADEIRTARTAENLHNIQKQKAYKNEIIDGTIRAIKEDIRRYAELDPVTNLYKCSRGIVLAQSNDLLYKLIIAEKYGSEARLFSSKKIREFKITDLGAEIHTEIMKSLEKEKINIKSFSICTDGWPEGPYYGTEIKVLSWNLCKAFYVLPVRFEIPESFQGYTRILDGEGQIHMTKDRNFGTKLCIFYTYQE